MRLHCSHVISMLEHAEVSLRFSENKVCFDPQKAIQLCQDWLDFEKRLPALEKKIEKLEKSQAETSERLACLPLRHPDDLTQP